MFKRYLLSSAVCYALRTEGGGTPSDNVELEADNDEEVLDPEGEPDDNEPEPEPDDNEPEPEPEDIEPEPEVLRTRGNRQFGELRERARTEAERADRLARELDEVRRRQPVSTQEDPRVEAERLALMSSDERADYKVEKALRVHREQQQQFNNQLLDQADRTAYDARATNDPLRRKLGPEIERELAGLRAKGQNLPRESIYIYLLGQRAEAQRGKAKPKAAERVRRETTRPGGGRGDVAPDRRGRSEQAAREKRLENMEI